MNIRIVWWFHIAFLYTKFDYRSEWEMCMLFFLDYNCSQISVHNKHKQKANISPKINLADICIVDFVFQNFS